MSQNKGDTEAELSDSPKTSNYRPWAALLLAIGVGLTMFQNCGTYVPIEDEFATTNLASTCLGPSCALDINDLAFSVGNTDPILVTRTTETAIDLGGYCSTAGYPDSKIYAELRSGATVVVAPYLTTAKCDEKGRFRILFPLPGTYNYNLAYSIIVTLRAVDSSGNEYDHPTGVNRRELSLLTAP